MPSTLGALPVEDDEICPPDALKDMAPDEEHFHEATGNEGASFERTYRRAALVLWPHERIYAVLNQAGLSVTLPYLQDLIERWDASSGDARSVMSHQADELAGHMLSTWPRSTWRSEGSDGPSEAARMLALLTRLGAAERVDTFVTANIAGGYYEKSDNEAILGALRLFSPKRASALLKRIVEKNAAESLGACGNLLAEAVNAFPNDLTALHAAAAALVAQLPGDPSKERLRDPWRRDDGVRPDFVVDLFTAVEVIDAALAEHAARHILAWPKSYGLDMVLVPALRTLTGFGEIKLTTSIRHLRKACVGHLRARASEPLQAPGDWKRESNLACRCAPCGELSCFLADAERNIWILKAAEAVRGHVEETIRKTRCDVDVTTDRRGRPYSLMCSKNQVSYDLRVKQRNQDLVDLALFGDA